MRIQKDFSSECVGQIVVEIVFIEAVIVEVRGVLESTTQQSKSTHNKAVRAVQPRALEVKNILERCY